MNKKIISVKSPIKDWSSLSLFMKDIAKIPVLTKKEEIALGKRIMNGLKAEEVLNINYPKVSAEIDRILTLYQRPWTKKAFIAHFKKFQKNTTKTLLNLLGRYFERYDAANALVKHNIRLVVSRVKTFSFNGLTFNDLNSEGVLGLRKAAFKYNYTLGYKFSTFAIWYINQAIFLAIQEKSKIVRVPVHIWQDHGTINKYAKQYKAAYGKEPTLSWLSIQTGIKVGKIVKILFNMNNDAVSFENSFPGNSEHTLGHKLEDNINPGTQDVVENNQLVRDLQKVLNKLNGRERAVIIMRYGLFGEKPHSLQETGFIYGVTRERARQIEGRALAKLKNVDLSKILEGYI